VGYEAFPKVSPTKGIVHFDTKGKLCPMYIGPYVIIAHVGTLRYGLQLPESMAIVHTMFLGSMLRKYLKDPEQIMEAKPVTIKQDLIVEYHPVQILESFECVMSKWTIEYVKVL
jgi:hypothetical protein